MGVAVPACMTLFPGITCGFTILRLKQGKPVFVHSSSLVLFLALDKVKEQLRFNVECFNCTVVFMYIWNLK